MSEKTAEILEKAADLLESDEIDWIRGDFEVLVRIDADRERYGHCAVGALCKAAGEHWNNQQPMTVDALTYVKAHIIDKVFDLARKVVGSIPSILPSREAWPLESALIFFNDRIAEDKAEIVEVFKLAAKDARNQA